MVTGLCGMVIAIPFQSVLILLVSTVITGFGQGRSFKGSMTLINEVTPIARKADVISSFYVMIYLGVGFPVVGIGYAAAYVGMYEAVKLFTWGIGLIGFFLLAFIIGSNKNGMTSFPDKNRDRCLKSIKMDIVFLTGKCL